MVELALPLSCEVKRVMPVGLLTDAVFSFIDHPRLVPVPYRPLSVAHMEVLLEALAEPPLHRLIVHCKPVMIVLEHQIPQGENGLSVSCSLYLQEMLGVDLDDGVAFLQEGVDA